MSDQDDYGFKKWMGRQGSAPPIVDGPFDAPVPGRSRAPQKGFGNASAGVSAGATTTSPKKGAADSDPWDNFLPGGDAFGFDP